MTIIPLFFYILTKKGAIHMKKKLITAVVTFALALSSLTGCGGAATSGNTSTQTTGDSSVITIARPIDSSTLDPIMTGNN